MFLVKSEREALNFGETSTSYSNYVHSWSAIMQRSFLGLLKQMCSGNLNLIKLDAESTRQEVI